VGLPGFNAGASLYRSSVHYVPAMWVGIRISPVVDFNIRDVVLPSGLPIVPWGLPKCTPPQGALCGFASGPPYDFVYCCPSGYVCCNPSCLSGSSTCVGCCPKDNPQCCLQNGSGSPSGLPKHCPYPYTNCGLIPGAQAHFSCCSPTEKCCNAATHLCCGKLEACCGDTCCPPGFVCSDPTTGTCCLPGKSCGSKCCGFSESCIDGFCCPACTGGKTCVNGKCVCPSGLTDCNGSCTRLLFNDLHCGGCDIVCPGGMHCNGEGDCVCPEGLTECSGSCTSLMTNSNCGSCGNSCTGGKICSGGVCVCPTGLTDCGGTCKNLLFDPKNCGACGSTCGFCCSGKCGVNCNNGTCCQDPTDVCCPNGTTCGLRVAGITIGC
jgi:hypothetical protein